MHAIINSYPQINTNEINSPEILNIISDLRKPKQSRSYRELLFHSEIKSCNYDRKRHSNSNNDNKWAYSALN